MEDKVKRITEEKETQKLKWEPPLLISLDKDKTEGGTGIGTESFTTYPGS